MKVAEDGARFNPFPGPGGDNVLTLYAADQKHTAALESVFHDVDHSPSPSFPKSRLVGWQCGKIQTGRNLVVLELTNPSLRQLPVRGRKASIREAELIHTPASEYPHTRTWARFLHQSIPSLDGLRWRPRLGGTGWAYVFFGDRCKDAIQSSGSSSPIHMGKELADIEQIAKAASIRLLNP